MKFLELKIGEQGQIVSVDNMDFKLKRKLLEMGFTRGTLVKIKKIAPLGDPVSIEIRGYELCLRKCDLKNIEVIRV